MGRQAVPDLGDENDEMPQEVVRRPRVHRGADDRQERHASWLELFFDLVFVVAVSELANLLHRDLSLGGLAAFALLFAPVWWQWLDFSYYADQFESDDLLTRLVTLLTMFGVLVMAITLHGVVEGGSTGFALAYSALRLVLIGQYLRAWRAADDARELAGRYALIFSFALAIWLGSLLAPEPARFLIWGLALLVEVSAGPITYLTIGRNPQQLSHMDERLGLFVIVVLGEAVIAVSTGVFDADWHWRGVIAGACGFLIAASLWWIYFARADASVINQALRSEGRALLRSFIYAYSHVLVFVGIAAAGVGIELTILHAPTELLPLAHRIALCGGVATFLVGVTIVQWFAPRRLAGALVWRRLVGAAFCLGLIFLVSLSATTTIALVVALLVGQVGYELAAGLHERRAIRLRGPAA